MKKFRVGYYVEVEVEAVDAGDAIHIADGAMGWWDRAYFKDSTSPHWAVHGEAMGKRVEGDVRRIDQLYSHSVSPERDSAKA